MREELEQLSRAATLVPLKTDLKQGRIEVLAVGLNRCTFSHKNDIVGEVGSPIEDHDERGVAGDPPEG